jgi:hypothetical protein
MGEETAMTLHISAQHIAMFFHTQKCDMKREGFEKTRFGLVQWHFLDNGSAPLLNDTYHPVNSEFANWKMAHRNS